MKAKIIGRLIAMFLMTVLRLVMQPLFFISLILFTLFETVVNGLASGITHLQKLNSNELATKTK